MKLGILIAALLIGSGANAGAFDSRAHRDFAGPPTELLVLGTPHLSGLPASFEVSSLAPVLDRLAAWRPTVIMIENLSGSDCDVLRRDKARFENAFDTYCWELDVAEKATGLNLVAAMAEGDRLLAARPVAATPAARRHLASVFIAAGERASALVQWLRLPAAERHEGDGLNAELVAILKKAEASRNESYAVAATLAARLGLERVYPVDDHSADAAVANLGKPYEEALGRIWGAAGPRVAAMRAEEAKLGTPAATLAHYRYHNRPQAADEAFAYDFGAALKDVSPALYGRRYVGWWETRNLRMVANIRAVMTANPGARVLAVVGSSHKGYYEAYLGMMHDVRIADVQKVLK